MKKHLPVLIVLLGFGLVSSLKAQDNFAITSPEQLSETATVELNRERAFLFSALKARVRLNGSRVAQVKNGGSESIRIPSGRNTLAVSGFGAPGESTVSFIAKPGESYSFVIAPRSSNFWAGITGGVFGVGLLWSTAFESTFSSSEGGTFGIALSGSSEFNKKTIQESTPSAQTDNVEKELLELKDLYEKGLIDEEVYKAKQKELLGL